MQSLTDYIKPVVPTDAPGYSYVEELGVFVHDMHAVLVKEIQDELADPAFQKYRHGRCGTNNKGCSGPMCRWARRTWQHANARAHAARKGKPFKQRPLLENVLSEDLFQAYDAYLDKVWSAKREHAKLAKEIKKVVSKPDPEPLRNLQATECRDYEPLLFGALI